VDDETKSGVRAPWRILIVAVTATALLAAGVTAGVSYLIASSRPAPQLHTVSAATLSGAAISLAPADQPPYCDLEQGAVQRGWVGTASGGCAVSRQEASRAIPAGQAVLEAVLVRIDAPDPSPIGHGRLAWLLVVRSSLLMLPTTGCAPPVASGPACSVGRLGPVSNVAIVVVDGSSGEVVTTLSVPSG